LQSACRRTTLVGRPIRHKHLKIRVNHLRTYTVAALVAVVFATTGTAFAAVAEAGLPAGDDPAIAHGFAAPEPARAVAVQRNGMTLSEAVESVRRRGNVERVISAETQVENGQEIHVIKVLTTDGKVRTHRIPGRRRD
jgi:hypothetical protein